MSSITGYIQSALSNAPKVFERAYNNAPGVFSRAYNNAIDQAVNSIAMERIGNFQKTCSDNCNRLLAFAALPKSDEAQKVYNERNFL